MTVAIVRASNENVLDKFIELLTLINYKPKRRQIFIKPNIVAAQPPETGVITHPVVIEALLRYFQGYEIVIGESSSVAQDTDRVLELSGYAALGARYGARVVNLDKVERVRVPWRFGEISLPAMVSTHEYINVPKMKTHVSTVVSIGLKNQKGLLPAQAKRAFHLKWGLHQSIAALAQVIKPSLTVVDGLIALEGDGPGRAGAPVPMGLLLAGTDAIEVDTVAARIMGFGPGEVPHLADRTDFNTVGLEIDEVRRGFRRARQDHFLFGHVNVHLMRACSGCIEAFAAAFARADKSVFKQRVDVLMGFDTDPAPADHGAICYFGNCTRKTAIRMGSEFVPGCPPSGPEAIAAVGRITLGVDGIFSAGPPGRPPPGHFNNSHVKEGKS